MSSIIPNLWPGDLIPKEVLTPKEILEFQAEQLPEKTRGIIRGEIVTQTDYDQTDHHLELIVPVLGNYRYRLLTVSHDVSLPYPAAVQATAYLPGELMGRRLDQELLIQALGMILRDPSTRGILHALAAKAGERNRSRIELPGEHFDPQKFGDQPPNGVTG